MSVEIFLKGVSDTYETINTKIAYGAYKRAYNKEDKFETYRTYDPELLLKWGITENPTLASQWGNSPALIPDSLRGMVLLNQRNHVVRSYVEGNEYVRVRLGLPTLEEMEKKDFVYASEAFYAKFDMGPKPLHLFTEIDFVRLKNSGEYNKILTANPDRKYLKFIGVNKLDHFRMKEAKNFELISYDTTLDDRMVNDFITIYSQMRHYLVNVLYVKEFSTQYPHYDAYMSLLLTVMTMQRLIANIFKNGIDRDYYDLFNLQMLFESHNTPFMKDMPMDYQRVLARNLNRLLRMKSTDKVLYDVAELLGFEKGEFFKYYLVKQHKLDDDGVPIVKYKTIVNEQGEEEEVLDYENMYELYFQGVKFTEDDMGSSLGDVSNRIDYEDMILHDEFWWNEDAELNKILYETEYNIIETKYFGVQSMYRITEMIHEVARFFRMIIDNKEDTNDIFISLPRISSDKKLTFFETIIFAICLICKRNKSRGEIITTPSKTLGVIGFNFRADFDLIREHLEKNRRHIESDKIAQYILDIEMFTLEDINRVYGNAKELWEFLVDKMSRATTIEEYEAYDKLYKTLMYTDDMAEIFTLPNGTIAETYFDYLFSLNPELYLKLETATETQLFEMLEHIIYSLEDDLDNLEYLSFLIDNNGLMENAFKNFIMFLKSYTIDLKSISIIYLLDNRRYNMIKLIDQIDKFDAELTTGSKNKLEDAVQLFGDILTKDDMNIRENKNLFANVIIKSLYKLKSKLTSEAKMVIASKFNFEDYFMMESEMTYSDSLKIDDSYDFTTIFVIDEKIDFRDKISFSQVNYMAEKYNITDIPLINSHIFTETKINIDDRILTLIDILNKSKLKFVNKADIGEAAMDVATVLSLLNTTETLSTITGETKMQLNVSNVQLEHVMTPELRLIKDGMLQESSLTASTSTSLFDFLSTIDNVIVLPTKEIVRDIMEISSVNTAVKTSARLKERVVINHD